MLVCKQASGELVFLLSFFMLQTQPLGLRLFEDRFVRFPRFLSVILQKLPITPLDLKLGWSTRKIVKGLLRLHCATFHLLLWTWLACCRNTLVFQRVPRAGCWGHLHVWFRSSVCGGFGITSESVWALQCCHDPRTSMARKTSLRCSRRLGPCFKFAGARC